MRASDEWAEPRDRMKGPGQGDHEGADEFAESGPRIAAEEAG